MVGTVGAIVITILVLAVVAGISWVLYSRWRAQKLGLPPPSLTSFIPFHNSSSSSAYNPGPRPGGIQGWFSDQARKFSSSNKSNNRSAAGAYEGTTTNSNARGGFGPLDPDDAWDARVGGGPAAYYEEEQELGLHPTGYGGGGGGAESYSMNLASTPRMGPEMDRGREAAGVGRNPFDDDAEPSNLDLRGVSPRPMEGQHGGSKNGRESPTERAERRSIFTEDV